MNRIIVICLINIVTVFGGSKTFAVQNYPDTLNAVTLVNALQPLLDRPLSWCSINPVGDIRITSKSADSTTIKMDIEIECSEGLQRKYLNMVWNKHKTFIESDGAATLIDREMSKRYSDIELRWGVALNDHYYVKIHRKSSHGGTIDFNNKTMFFNIVFNDTRLDGIYRASLPGSVLAIIETNTNKPVMCDTLKYTFKVGNELIKDDITISTEHVWHVDENVEVRDSKPF